MSDIDTLLQDYNLGRREQQLLASLYPHMKSVEDEFIEVFYAKLMSDAQTARFLEDEKTVARLKHKHGDWFLKLFSGSYDIDYLRNLERIGQAHVRIGLPGHFVNSSMALVRHFCIEQIERAGLGDPERRQAIDAVNDIIDLNLDIMTASYRENELRAQMVDSHGISRLLFFSTRILFFFQLTMLFALALVAILVIGLFAYDLYSMLDKELHIGLLSALGSLVIMWTVLELMDKEVRHLKGGEFPITAFISVAIAAIIREILVMSFSHEVTAKDWIMVASLLALGIVYFLVRKRESRRI